MIRVAGLLMLTAVASATAAERLAEFDNGRFETLLAPGFEVDVQNCDGSETLVDLLPLPRPLSHRYAGSTVTVAAPLSRGRPSELEYIEGDRQLLSALRFPLERSRYADTEPRCVLLRIRVTETTLRAAETVNFRTWVDVAVSPDGRLQRAAVVGTVPGMAGRLLLETMEDWRLPANDDVMETSVLVNATLMPNADGDFEVAAVPEVVGPRPRRTWEPRRPQHMFDLGHYFEGEVVLEFDVDEKGKPRKIRVVHSNPPGAFDSPAVAAMRKWRYTVVTVGGEPVPVQDVRQRIRFNEVSRPLRMAEQACSAYELGCVTAEQRKRRKERQEALRETRRRAGRPN